VVISILNKTPPFSSSITKEGGRGIDYDILMRPQKNSPGVNRGYSIYFSIVVFLGYIIEVCRLAARPEMPQEERPFQLSHEDGAVHHTLGEMYECRVVKGVLFPILPEGHLYRGAQVFHVFRVGGNEH